MTNECACDIMKPETSPTLPPYHVFRADLFSFLITPSPISRISDAISPIPRTKKMVALMKFKATIMKFFRSDDECKYLMIRPYIVLTARISYLGPLPPIIYPLFSKLTYLSCASLSILSSIIFLDLSELEYPQPMHMSVFENVFSPVSYRFNMSTYILNIRSSPTDMKCCTLSLLIFTVSSEDGSSLNIDARLFAL